ncbi:MAG: glycosyltransferase family 9 protein [Sulfuricella sp.]
MKLGTISEVGFVINDPQGDKWEIHSFTLSPDSLAFSKLPDSAFSTPARYVLEMFNRLCLTEEGHETTKFIFNPLYATNRLTVLLVLATLQALESPDSLAVLTDKSGMPAGYLFPSWFKAADSHFLALLSTVHGETDAELLQRVFFTTVPCIPVDHLCLRRSGHNGFLYEENRSIYQWVAGRAINMLKSHVTADNQHEAECQRNAIPFTAVMPYHAGDVLFFTIAFNHIRPPVSRIVINKAYRCIVADNAPTLVALPIDLPLVNRDEDFRRGNVTPDHAYFERFCNELPEDSFYGYYRSSRNYNITKLHLIDHFAFALGGHLCSRAELLLNKKPAPDVFTPTPSSGPRRVLLHFDGGWPLKIYPKEQQEKLIDLLYAKGYSVTVLAGTPYEHPKCQVTTFKGYEPFIGLLRSHHLLVGMDSFPAHYAAHVLGLPTICLFASTRPENSDARAAPNYTSLEKGLRCRPCSGISQCPLYGDSYCRNFGGPETVAAEVERMLETVGKGRAEQPNIPTMPPEIAEDCRPQPKGKQLKIKHISLSHIRLKVALTWVVLPYLRYLLQLYREFVTAVRVDGLLLASLRALRFLRRALRR